MWLSAQKSAQFLGVSPNTLRTWDKKGLIKTQRTPTNYRLYDVSSFKTDIQVNDNAAVKQSPQHFIYCRVSSPKQKRDLERQISALQEIYPEYTVISDIASGINFQRKGLQKLLQLSSAGLVKTVVCSHRDRLGRFAFELIEYVFSLNGTKVVVHYKDENVSSTEELSQDILAINTVFICRMQGSRAAENRRNRKQQFLIEQREIDEIENKQDPAVLQQEENKQDPAVLQQEAKEVITHLDRML